MRIDNVEIILLSDGQARMDGGAMFGVVPRPLWERAETPDEINRVPIALTSLLIRSSGKTILVDTGYGDKLPTKRREILALKRDPGLPAALAALGLSADDVDIVINTHLHADHCGGNTVLAGGCLVPAYPRAEYWVQRLEWAEAICPNERTQAAYLPDNLLPIGPQLRLLEGDTWVTPEVRCLVTRGHTRAHQSVIVQSGHEVAVCLGDLAPFAVHLERLAWNSATDVEPLEALETKRSLRGLALEKNALLIFAHDTSRPAGRLERQGDEWRVVPLETGP